MANFIYGKYAVQSFIQKYPEYIEEVYFSRDEHKDFIEEALPTISKSFISNKELRQKFSIKEFESHQGIVLCIKQPLNELMLSSLEELLMKASFENKPLLWLPSIQDAHNLGAVIRSCVAFNVAGIILPSSRSVTLNRVVAKVSAGAIFNLQYAIANSFAKASQLIQMNGFKLLALEKNINARPLSQVQFKEYAPYVLTIGSEEKGIPQAIRNQVNQFIEIPQSNEVESLNLSVATAITLYEISKQIN
ncbi:MAG TPA: RNA methyltransferase [Vampirovibrionales bacterium]